MLKQSDKSDFAEHILTILVNLILLIALNLLKCTCN